MSKTSQARLDQRSDVIKYGGYYLVTAHPPTSISFSVTTNFTGICDTNLIIAKSSKIIIQDLTPTGVVDRLRLDVFGRVAAMIPYQPEGSETSLLFVLTEKWQFFILAYDVSRNAVVTRSCGDFSVDFGTSLDRGLIARLDPSHRAIFLFLNQGTVKVLPLVRREDLKNLQARPKPFRLSMPIPAPVASREYEVGDIMDPRDCLFDVLQVVDVAVLENGVVGLREMLLAVLYANHVTHRALAFYRYDSQAKRLIRFGHYDVPTLNPTAGSLLALEGGSVVIFSKELATVTKITSKSKEPVMNHLCLPHLEDPICYTTLDPQRSFIMGGARGTLQLLAATFSPDKELPRIELTTLGTAAVPSSLCYLDNYLVYIGSHYGDSHMVRLNLNPPFKIEVVESYPSISPVVDLTAEDFSAQGPDQVVTCSGGSTTGRLHILRSGAGYQELANLELPGIGGLWSLCSALAVSFLNQTRVLGFDETGAIHDRELPGFQHSLPSLAVASCHGLLVQATRTEVFLIHPDTGLLFSWASPSPIVVASITPTHVAVGLRGGLIVLFQLSPTDLKELASTQMPHEIACLDIRHFCVVGLWSAYQVHVLSLPELMPLAQADLPGEMVPLTLLQIEMAGIPRLLASMADGRVLFFRMDPSNGHLFYPGSLAPGTCPTTLVPYFSNGQQLVLATADRSAVIYPYRDTLVYAFVNGRGPTSHACLMQGGEYDGTMVFADPLGVTIGQVAQVQRLHVRSIPLKEAPRRLAPMLSSATLGVITSTYLDDGSETSFLRLFKTPDMEACASHSFQANESVLSLACISLPQFPDMYAVGTTLLEGDNLVPGLGYIYLFGVKPNCEGLELVARHEVRGAVQSLKATHDGFLASINGKVVLMTLTPQRELLELSCSYGRIHVVDMDASDDYAIVGDLMRSCQILHHKGGQLFEVARDPDMRWATAVHLLDDLTYLLADCHGNLVVFRRRCHDPDPSLRHQLEVIGHYNLGDQVNRIVKGSLVFPPGISSSDSQIRGRLLSSAAGQTTTQDKEGSFLLEDIPFQPSVLGTLSGAIQLINPLPPRTFHLLLQLERNILHYIGGVGNIKHRVYRAFQDTKRTLEPKGFIDGDVIELYLKLDPQAQLDIIRGISNQDRHSEFPPLQEVSAMAGASYQGLSLPPVQGQSRYKDARTFESREKFRLVTGREAYDDGNRLVSNHPHPIPISHISLVHLLNDLTRLH